MHITPKDAVMHTLLFLFLLFITRLFKETHSTLTELKKTDCLTYRCVLVRAGDHDNFV